MQIRTGGGRSNMAGGKESFRKRLDPGFINVSMAIANDWNILELGLGSVAVDMFGALGRRCARFTGGFSNNCS